MFWSFVLAAVLIELTPGPNMTWLAVLGASRGRLTALAAVAGVGLGLAIAAVIAGFGLTTILLEVPALFQALRWAGTLYLFYLAWEAWSESSDISNGTAISYGPAFRRGLISNVLNPKAYLFYAALLPQFISYETDIVNELTLLSATYVLVATAIHGAIALLAGSMAQFLQTSPHAVTIRKALAILIALAACWFFYATKLTG